MKLNLKQQQIHERAMRAAAKFQKAEAEMIEVLQEVDHDRIHRCFGKSSLLEYAISYLRLSEPIALEFIAVARKSVEVPLLKAAISQRRLSASSANRLVSTINKDNASELIDFAATHTWRETERELANRNPRAAAPDRVKMLGNGLVEITVTVTEAEHKDFERACLVEAQRKSAAPKRGQVFVAAVKTHLDKYDPVRKAERAQKRSVKTQSEKEPQLQAKALVDRPPDSERSDQNLKKPNDSKAPTGRTPPTAGQLHAVNLRDQGCCTHVNECGVKCNQDRWIEIHHIIPVSQGGTNDLHNLTTLCSFHHDLAHQLTLPLEGQITWLRDRVIPYRI